MSCLIYKALDCIARFVPFDSLGAGDWCLFFSQLYTGLIMGMLRNAHSVSFSVNQNLEMSKIPA